MAIVESGPIHLEVSMAQAVAAFIQADPELQEALQEFVKEWVLKKLREQAEAQKTEGEGQDG